jgi:hypothetical protein
MQREAKYWRPNKEQLVSDFGTDPKTGKRCKLDANSMQREHRRAAVRPHHELRAVVAGIHDDGVVCDAKLLQLVEQLADIAIVLVNASFAPGRPTLVRPVRMGDCPIMNAERPAVQPCWSYQSMNLAPSAAILSMLGVS